MIMLWLQNFKMTVLYQEYDVLLVADSQIVFRQADVADSQIVFFKLN